MPQASAYDEANKRMLVVDAYNALHVTGVLPPDIAGLEVPELAALVALSRWGRDEVVLVCDGAKARRRESDLGAKDGRPGRGAVSHEESAGASAPLEAAAVPSNIRITYAGAGRSADEAIAKLVRDCSHPTQLTVVSNDRQVQASARKRRASVLAADEWLAQLAADFAGGSRRRSKKAPHRGPLSPQEADEWLRYFDRKP